MIATSNCSVLVLGLGNRLLADDGAGVHVVRRLLEDRATPPWVRAVDGGTMGFRLTSLLEDNLDVLVVDAAELSEQPGTIRLIGAQALADHVAKAKRTSAHEAGLADLLSLVRLQDLTLRHLAVLAIQPQVIDWGETLSAPVANAIAPACHIVIETAAAWCREA